MFQKSSIDDTLYEKHSLQNSPMGGAKPLGAHSHICIHVQCVLYALDHRCYLCFVFCPVSDVMLNCIDS